MTILLTIIHILVCSFLIVVVLLQSGKAADLAGAFGGMGSQTAFGARGSATVLSKATAVAAALFMISSLSLAILATRNAASSGSVLERTKKSAAPKTTPAQGAPNVKGTTNNGAAGQPIPLNIPPMAPSQPVAPKK